MPFCAEKGSERTSRGDGDAKPRGTRSRSYTLPTARSGGRWSKAAETGRETPSSLRVFLWLILLLLGLLDSIRLLGCALVSRGSWFKLLQFLEIIR